eukprot:Em0005g591a
MASPEPSSPKRPVPEPLHLEPENAHLSWTAAMAFHKLATKLYKLTSITEHNDPMSPVKKSFPMNVLIPDNAVIDETTYEDFQHVEEYAGTVGMYSSGKNFQVFSAASAAEIDSLWSSLLAIDHEMRLRHDDKITAKDLSPALADFMAHCCKQRHYFFDILKCGKPECMLCKPLRLSASEFSKLSHLPDSTPGTDGHYKPFQEVFKKPTTEEHRPSAKKASSKATLPFRASVQHVHNAGMMLQCDECALWRLVYAKRKLNSAEKKDLESAIDSMSYSWGRRERSTAGCDPQPKIRKMLKLVATLMVDGKMCRNSNVGVLEPQPNFMERHGTFGGNQQRWCNPRANVESRMMIHGAEYVVYYASRTLTKAKHSWLHSFKEPEGQVARWLEHLEEYEFTVQHRPGVHATTDQRGSNVGGWALQWTCTKQEVIQFQTDDPDIGQMKRWMKEELHDAPTGGHLGVAKVLEKAQQRFYWLMFGHNYPLTSCLGSKPLGVITTSTSEYARALEQRLVAAYENVREHLGIEQRRHKQLYDPVPQGHSKKLHACWKGPYTVAKVYEKGVYQIKWNLPPHKQQVVHCDRLKPYLTRHLDDEPMPDESSREEHSLDETTEDEALIQDRSTDETTSESQYEDVLVEREDDTLVRKTEPDMLQGVEHGTESQLLTTGDAIEEDPENLVLEMDDTEHGE